MIIEHTKIDYYWCDGSGQNVLVKLLMQLRSELQLTSDTINLVLPSCIAFPNIS